MKKNSETAARVKVRPRMRSVFRRFASLGRDGPERWLSLEEVRRRLRNAPSFLDSLSPEAWEMIRNGIEPEMLGPPDDRYKRK